MNKRGEILYAYKQGAKLIKRSGEVVWDYKVGENEAVYSASVIESGNYMIAIAGKPLARIVELNGKNEVLKEVRFNTTTFDVSRQFRQVLKTPQNTYLVPLTFKRKISEISEEGRYLKSVLCNGAPNAVKIAANGNWVVSCGSIHSFSEIDPQTKKIVKTIETTNLNWGSLLYVSELVCYPNGNTLVSNSSMESDDKSQPMLLEIDPDGQVVWRMPFNPGITNITTVHSFYE